MKHSSLFLFFIFLFLGYSAEAQTSSLDVFDKTHTFTNDFIVNYSSVYADCVYIDSVIGVNSLKYCSYSYKIIKSVKVPDKFNVKSYNSKSNLNLSLDYIQYNTSDMIIYFYARGKGEFNISCENCVTHDPNVSCGTIYQNSTLNGSIIDVSGTCIILGESNIELDCMGYTIDGVDTGAYRGVYSSGKENNTVRNCIITDFQEGIYLAAASNNNILTNNTLNSNTQYGIYVYQSSNNNIINNNLNKNTQYGIRLSTSSTNNIITNNTANLNTISGIRLGSSSNNNNITNNNLNLNTQYGIYLETSSNNIINNTANNNTKGGLYFSAASTGNLVNNNTACSNGDNITLFDIFDLDTNSGNNNTCDTTNGYNDTGVTGCTYACGTTCTANRTNNSFIATTNCTNFTQNGTVLEWDTNNCSGSVNITYNITNQICSCNSTWSNVSTTNITECISNFWNISTIQTDISLCNLTNKTIINYNVSCGSPTKIYYRCSEINYTVNATETFNFILNESRCERYAFYHADIVKNATNYSTCNITISYYNNSFVQCQYVPDIVPVSEIIVFSALGSAGILAYYLSKRRKKK
jgi:parallel beta-helix repeat protein